MQAKDGTLVTVTGRGDELYLTSLNSGTGETISDRVLPGAAGFTVGTSIGPDGQVITASYLGEIFTYAP